MPTERWRSTETVSRRQDGRRAVQMAAGVLKSNLECLTAGTFEKEIRKAEQRLISRVSDYILSTKEGLASIPRDIYVCDPPVHRFGK